MLFVFELLSLEMHSAIVLAKSEEFRDFDWDGSENLYFCWNSLSFGVWSPFSIKAVNPNMSKPVKVSSLRFAQDRSALELKGLKSVFFFYVDASSQQRLKYEKKHESHASFEGMRESESFNLKKLDLSVSDTVRRSQDIRTQDLIDEYDQRNTPEKLFYGSHDSFGGGPGARRPQLRDQFERGAGHYHRFEE